MTCVPTQRKGQRLWKIMQQRWEKHTDVTNQWTIKPFINSCCPLVNENGNASFWPSLNNYNPHVSGVLMWLLSAEWVLHIIMRFLGCSGWLLDGCQVIYDNAPFFSRLYPGKKKNVSTLLIHYTVCVWICIALIILCRSHHFACHDWSIMYNNCTHYLSQICKKGCMVTLLFDNLI